MKIRRVRATPVRVPITRAVTFSKRKRTHLEATIVEVASDDGLTGVGETRARWPAAVINERFAPLLRGVDPDDRTAVFDACMPSPFDHGFPEWRCDLLAFAGVEMALWDLAGKRSGQPLYQMLGGPVRERAPFGAYSYAADLDEAGDESTVPQRMAGLARQGIDQSGATLFEFKIAVHSVPCDIDTILAVRDELGPDIDIAVDANMGLTIEVARQLLAGVADARLANIEEPVASLREMVQLRREFDVPMSTHCFDVDTIAAYGEIDAVVSDIQAVGGIDRTLELIRQVTALGRGFWLRAHWDTGIGWAAMCHLGIALPPLDRPAQALMQWIEDDLIDGPVWHVRQGGVRPPARPGLGIELDRTSMARYTAP